MFLACNSWLEEDTIVGSQRVIAVVAQRSGKVGSEDVEYRPVSLEKSAVAFFLFREPGDLLRTGALGRLRRELLFFLSPEEIGTHRALRVASFAKLSSVKEE